MSSWWGYCISIFDDSEWGLSEPAIDCLAWDADGMLDIERTVLGGVRADLEPLGAHCVKSTLRYELGVAGRAEAGERAAQHRQQVLAKQRELSLDDERAEAEAETARLLKRARQEAAWRDKRIAQETARAERAERKAEQCRAIEELEHRERVERARRERAVQEFRQFAYAAHPDFYHLVREAARLRRDEYNAMCDRMRAESPTEAMAANIWLNWACEAIEAAGDAARIKVPHSLRIRR